jgi:hypothetical protein
MPNDHKVTKWPYNIPNGSKIVAMAVKYTNIFHSKTYPKWDFWYEKIPSGNPDLQSNLRLSNVTGVKSWSQSYDFPFYSYNASVVLD